jgi:hypothetical protein
MFGLASMFDRWWQGQIDVAGDRMKFDGKHMWFLEGNIWVSYTVRNERTGLREFELCEVFPYVKSHYHPTMDQRKILRFDGDLDISDLESCVPLLL